MATTEKPKLNEAVLIVEDEPELRELLKEIVNNTGFRAITAANGSDGLTKLKEDTFFYVLTDYLMPVMNGIDFSKRVRESFPFLPIAMLTAYGEKALVVDAIRTVITDFLDKPFEPDKIMVAIEKCAANRLVEIERELRELEDLRQIFVEEAQGVLGELESLVQNLASGTTDANELNLIYRKVHTLKGSAGTIPTAGNLVKLAHIFETTLTNLKEDKIQMLPELQATMLSSVDLLTSCVQCLARQDQLPDTSALQQVLADFNTGKSRAGAVATATISANDQSEKKQKGELAEEGLIVTNEKLEMLKELSGELVAFKNTFDVFLKQNTESLGHHLRELMDMDRILFKITDQLQTNVSDMQQVTLAKTFSKFPRIVRQVSGEVGKQIKLQLVGQSMTVDRLVSRALGDALIHAVRNSCDHGIEKPEVRTKAGKNSQGTISIRGSLIGDLITIEIHDDGAGLDRGRILNKAVEKGIVDKNEANNLSDSEIWDFLFLPNFSTAAQISNISGRGVGMDVVKTVATKFGGHAWFQTTAGQSTILTIQFPIPRSLVVEQSIVAKANDVMLAIPLSAITEIRDVTADEMSFLKPFWTFQHRGTTVPVGSFHMFISDDDVTKEQRIAASSKRTSLVAILNHQGKYVGLHLDAIVDQLEAVIRPFNEVIGKISGFRGVSRLPGDGVAYVVSAEDAIRNVYDLSKVATRTVRQGERVHEQ